MTILKRTGELFGTKWIQFEVITDGLVRAIEVRPAGLYGWKVVRQWEQGKDDWDNRTAAQILAWRKEYEPTLETVTDMATIELVVASLTKAALASEVR